MCIEAINVSSSKKPTHNNKKSTTTLKEEAILPYIAQADSSTSFFYETRNCNASL